MSYEMTPSERQAVARDRNLARLAERANQVHKEVADSLQRAVANALEVGHALLEAKEVCEDGNFTAWLKANFEGGLSTARGYMRLVVNWDQLGGDLQRAGGLSQRQLSKLLKGLPCSDGRANPRSRVAKQLPAPTAAPVEHGGPSSGNPLDEPPPVTASGDPLAVVGRLLEQAVDELRRVADACVQEAPYARHLLQLLERIRLGIPTRLWFWEMVKK